MSYGWLTESALISKPSKKINVDSSSLVDLTAMLEKERKKREGKEIVRPPTKKVFVQTNKGVEGRNRKDLEVAAAEVINGKARLEEKAKIYESMMKGDKDKKGQYLVDFEAKKFDEMTEAEKDEFENDRQQFYNEYAKVAQEREANIAGRRGAAELTGQFDEQESERLKWEAEALKDMSEGITEEMKEEMKKRVLVKQSYDKAVSNQEKEKLVEVIKEEKEDKKVAEDIKKKREETQRLRLEKLKKLNEKVKKDEEASGNNTNTTTEQK